MNPEIKCPQCSQPAAWQDNPDRPFCSERCKLIDLGQWADESYRISGSAQDTMSDDNAIYIQDKKQEIERT